MTRLRAATATDTGRVRASNQDLALVEDNLVAVADGVGGHAGGEVAARIAIDVLRATYAASTGVDALVGATANANRAVFEEAEHKSELRGMGTTITALALFDTDTSEQIALVNVGDSRAYLLESSELSRLTEDHSLVELLVRQGELTPEEAAVHPQRHIVTRALGIEPDVEIDTWMLEPRVGMRFLLCSDGLTNECSDDEIAAVLRDYEDPGDAASDLVRRALGHGGNDNITVVVADVETDQEPIAAAPAASPAPPIVEDVARSGSAPSVRAPRAERPAQRPSEPYRAPRSSERIVTVRVVAFVIVLLAIFGGIIGFTIWFNRATYFVTFDQGRVAIFEGRPGGFLWFHPTLVERSSITEKSVLDANLPLLKAGVLESSYAAAAAVVSNLSNEESILGISVPSTTTTTSTLPVSTTTAPSGVGGASGTTGTLTPPSTTAVTPTTAKA